MCHNSVELDEVDSNVQAPTRGATANKPVSEGQRSEIRETFFHMMSEWFNEYMRTNPMVQHPPPPPVPPPVPPVPLVQNQYG